MKPSELGKELKRVGSVATEKEMNGYMQKLSMDAFRDLVMFSAVDTGFLRSNWDVTTGNPGNAILHDIEGGSFGDATWPGTSVKVGDKVILFNNTEYAMHLETGTPRMRAQPMIEPTYHRVLSQAKRLANALSKKRVK